MYFFAGVGKSGKSELGYNIVFDNGVEITIEADADIFVSNFKSDTANLVKFNKILSKNCRITFDNKSDEIFESYFDSKKDYKYFKKFIKKLKKDV